MYLRLKYSVPNSHSFYHEHIIIIILTFNLCFQSKGAKGPIFEDGPNFDMAFKLFHGKDGVIPLNGNSQPCLDKIEAEPVPVFNPLASKAASISMSSFGLGGPFGFDSFFRKIPTKKSESSSKKEHSHRVCFLRHSYFSAANNSYICMQWW